MASIGSSKLQAVNRLAISVGQQPFSALGTKTGSWPTYGYVGSIEGQMERWLDETLFTIQTKGTYHNLAKCKPLTADGAGAITMPSTTLRVKAAGPNEHRNFTIVDGALYDLDRDTAVFTAGEVVYADVYKLIEFDKCPPELKELIITSAIEFVLLNYQNDIQRAQIAAAKKEDYSNGPGLPLVSVPPSPSGQQNAPTAGYPQVPFRPRQ